MRCKKCLITDKVKNTNFEKGVCNFCCHPQLIITPDRQKASLMDFEKTVAELQKSDAPHNCLVALSGGKDSAYLLHLLKNQYNLRPLAVTVSTGFLSPIATKNITQITKKLSVEHLFIRPERKFFVLLYRYFFKNPTDNLITHDICTLCTALMDFFMLETAAQKNIPVIFTGLSPEQVRPETFNQKEDQLPLYELDVRRLLQVPKFFNKDIIQLMEKRMEELNKKSLLPRLLYPLLALPYDHEKIKQTVEKQGLIKKSQSSPFKTNCLINALMIWSSVKRQGHNPYLESYSRLIRKNPSLRKEFLIMDFFINYRIKFGLFQNRLIKNLLKGLYLKKTDFK